MSISTQTLGTLNAAFRVQYADKMQNLIPEMTPIMSKIPFVQNNQKSGSVFIQPVILSMDHGFTCHGPSDNVLVLNAPVGHVIQQAQIQACAYSGRSWLSYSVLSRATGGAQAFIDATGHIVQSLSKSFAHMLEGIHWYGGVGHEFAGATARLNAIQVSMTAAQSAAFNWLGGEGMPIDIYDSTSTTLVLTTEIKAVVIGSSDGGTTNDGGITLTLASVTGLSDSTTYVIYRKGFKGVEHKGLKYILNTNNVFGIDGANYGLWKANRYALSSGALSFVHLSTAIARGIGRGMTGPLMGLVNPKAFRQLMPDYLSMGQSINDSTAAVSGNARSKRFSGNEEKSLVHGVKSIKIIVDSIETEIESTEFVKGGDGFFLDKETLVMVGSTMPTFSIPGLQNSNEYFTMRPDAAAAEIRIFADVSPFTEALNKSLLLTGIAP